MKNGYYAFVGGKFWADKVQLKAKVAGRIRFSKGATTATTCPTPTRVARSQYDICYKNKHGQQLGGGKSYNKCSFI